MKKSVYFILGIALLSVTACKTTVEGVQKDSVTTPPVVQKALLTADRDSVAWTANPGSSKIVSDTITLYGTGTTGLNDTLIFKLKYTSPGTYTLNSNQVSYHSAITDGTISNVHTIDDAYNNNITISYDMPTNITSGTFNVKFLDPGAKDISFLNGKFSVLLK